MTLDEAIKRCTSNAFYEKSDGNLQGCLEFEQLAEWLEELKRLKEQEPKTEQEIREELNRLSTYRVPNSTTDLVALRAVERVLNLVFRGHRDKEPKDRKRGINMTHKEEVITMLKELKEQSLKSCKDTAVLNVNIDSFIFVIDEAIKELEKTVLDKIRAEIRNLDDINPDYPMDKTIHIDRHEVLEIIDKYKTESEDKE